MKYISYFLIAIFFMACKSQKMKTTIDSTVVVEEPGVAESEKHENPRMQFKLIESKVADKNQIWKSIEDDLLGFGEEDYERLKPMIYEQDIMSMQQSVDDGVLSYTEIVKWYLYRIRKYESNAATTLESIIALNTNAVEEAMAKDKARTDGLHPIFGMPILLKDNIGVSGMATTAGAVALKNNYAEDATIVRNLRKAGAIILGKVNLSEWAYYFCDGCPLGYSAIGGQALNPYGRKIFETGGSSAGSGTTIAANYAAGAVGTETAGSILSPASQNSIIGLKPTIGLLSRTGIVPISSTLDTPGPMTRSVSDNAILLSAMVGRDESDKVTMRSPKDVDYLTNLNGKSADQIRIGANKSYYEILPLYKETIEKLKAAGVQVIEFDPKEVSLEGFRKVLDYDMKRDLPDYIQTHSPRSVQVRSVADVIEYNKGDMAIRAPYGQALFEGSRDDNTSEADMRAIKLRLEKDTRANFEELFETHQLDAIVSINNYDAAHAAMAKYPALALPMGYDEKGEPKAMTFIGKRWKEAELLQMGQTFMDIVKARKTPVGY